MDTFESQDFRLNRSKAKYVKCRFSKLPISIGLEMNIGDHIISQLTRFRQSDKVIKGDVNHGIRARLMR